MNGIDSFNSYNIFDNKHLKIKKNRLNSQRRRKLVKLGNCADELDSVWKRSLKGWNRARPPNILGQCKKDLKCIGVAFTKHLTDKDLSGALLDAESKIKSSASNISNESEVEAEKEPIKKIALLKARQTLRSKHFSLHVDDNVIIDLWLNELI